MEAQDSLLRDNGVNTKRYTIASAAKLDEPGSTFPSARSHRSGERGSWLRMAVSQIGRPDPNNQHPTGVPKVPCACGRLRRVL